MSRSSAAVRPLSALALWGLLAALYLVWPAVGLPSFLLSALSALVPLPLLFAFDSLLSFAVFYVGMGLLLQLAAGRRPTWRMALTAVLAALGLVLVQALVSDLSGLFLSADSGFIAVTALSLVNNLVRLAGMALVLCQALPGGLGQARHTRRGRWLLVGALLLVLLCGAADYGVFFCLPVGETAFDGQTGFLGVLDNLQLWSTASSISSWINRGWPELLLWLAVCLPARRQAGNE